MKSIARVIEEHKISYIIRTPEGDLSATVRGKFHIKNGSKETGRDEFPKVGDFVHYIKTTDDQAVIEEILPRKTVIIRDTADRSRRSEVERPQVIVANVDIVFIVMGLDGDFNTTRLDRYLALAKQSKAQPVIILNKADMLDADSADGKNSRADYERQTIAAVGDVPVHFVSAKTGEGMDAMLGYFSDKNFRAGEHDAHLDAVIGATGPTAVLLGSSGAGKSTITNWLLQTEKQATGDVRDDDSRGRHTTTSRELFDLPGGGHLIDTPGMRGLGLIGTADADDGDMFADVEAFIQDCRYPDCDHEKSEGCAVQEAIADGVLDAKRFASYQKVKREQEFKASKADRDSSQQRKNETRRIHKQYNKIQDQKYRDRGFV